MSYRIKIDPKNSMVDEAHLLSGMERAGVVLRQYRLPILTSSLVLLAMAVTVGIVVWLDQRHAEQAMILEQQATRLYLDRPTDQPQQADENLKKAIALYQQSLDQYPHSPTAPLALYHLANSLVQVNNFDGAIDAYQKFIVMYGGHKTLLSLVYQRLGYAYLLKNDVEQARKAFSSALDMPESLNKDQLLFELGKIEESQSRPEGALARYQELMKAHPNSPFTGEAAVRTKALDVKKTQDGSGTGTSNTVPAQPGGAASR
jgi:tetratricopeptide (TPR) repeat protein